MPGKRAYPYEPDKQAAFYGQMICEHMMARVQRALDSGQDEATASEVKGRAGFTKLQKEVGLDDAAFQKGLQWCFSHQIFTDYPPAFLVD